MLRPANRRPRPPLVLLAATVALGALTATGCAPPSPTPTPTPLFASEAEAFAAAEETYRAYVDASNRSRAGDKSADPQSFLVGEALNDDVSSSRQSAQNGAPTVAGQNKILTFRGSDFSWSTTTEVKADVCVDLSSVRILDASGHDVTPVGRPDRGLLSITFAQVGTQLRITKSQLAAPEC